MVTSIPGLWQRIGVVARRIAGVVVLIAVVRIGAGLAVIALFDRDAVAWGPEVTAIVVAAVAVPVLVALAVRRWSPRRRVS